MTGKEAYEYALDVVHSHFVLGDSENSYRERKNYSSINYYHRFHYYVDIQYGGSISVRPGMYYLYGEIVSKDKLSRIACLHHSIYVSKDFLAPFFVKWQELIDDVFPTDIDLHDHDVVATKCREFYERLSEFANSHGCYVSGGYKV